MAVSELTSGGRFVSRISDYEETLNEWDEVVHNFDQATNPFFRSMPMVAIVRQEATKNGTTLTTPDTQCQRVFFRVKNSRVFPILTDKDEIMPTGKARDEVIGFDNLDEFNPNIINADLDMGKRGH